MVNANLTEHKWIPFNEYFTGPYYDYTPMWYADVGFKIVQTQIIQSMLPYSTLVMGFMIPIMMRLWDNSCSCSKYKTGKTSMQPYKDVYSGVDYIIHFKYSGILSVTYLTLMYGVGMPILFPIAAFNLFN